MREDLDRCEGSCLCYTPVIDAEYIPDAVDGRYWQLLEDGRIQCDVCPRYCKLQEGQHGLCFVRARQDDKMMLTTYGRSSGFCIDPVEKKPLNHFLPGTPIPSFGTAGCNLTCKFCQNLEPHIPVWDQSRVAPEGKFTRADFIYDKERDI